MVSLVYTPARVSMVGDGLLTWSASGRCAAESVQGRTQSESTGVESVRSLGVNRDCARWWWGFFVDCRCNEGMAEIQNPGFGIWNGSGSAAMHEILGNMGHSLLSSD